MREYAQNAPIHMLLQQLVHLSKYQAMKYLEELDLKPTQAGILFTLSCNGKMSQRELAEKMGITPPSMTVALRKLELSGYIYKEQDQKDQRITRIHLSQKGEGCAGNIKAVIKDMEEILYQGITQEEKMLLKRLLLQMLHNMMESKEFRGMDIKTIMRQSRPPMEEKF